MFVQRMSAGKTFLISVHKRCALCLFVFFGQAISSYLILEILLAWFHDYLNGYPGVCRCEKGGRKQIGKLSYVF